jgi:HEAT repeat protein
MILIFFVLCDIEVDLERLYDQATTRLVSFQTVKDSAMEKFVTLGTNPASSDTTIKFLLSKFDTKSSVARHTLKDILKEIGIPAVKWIVHDLGYRGSDEEARSLKQSLWVLGEIGDSQIIESVARFIHDKSWSVRSSAYTALGKSNSDKAIDYLLDGLDDTVSLVRKSAFHALSALAAERELPHLLRGLSDIFYGVRYAALSGVRRIKAQVNVPLELPIDEYFNDCFVIATLDSVQIEYVFNEHYASVSPAARKVMYDMLTLNLLEDALSKETHPLLKKYINKRINELHNKH